jgi:DNA-binding CsgD family transcriptional regulator
MLGESLTHFRAAGDRWGVCWTLGNLGRVAHDEHDYQRAEALFEESLVLATKLAGRSRAVAYALHYLGVVASDQRHPDRAAHLFGAAAWLREVAGTSVSPLDRTSEEHELAVVRAALGEEQFAAAWEEGRAMSLEVATHYALARGRPATGAGVESRPLKVRPTYPLSSREHEVAVLLARGLTNRQVAAELVIAERTASTHVAHILNKLGFSSRTQIAAWAIEHDMTSR